MKSSGARVAVSAFLLAGLVSAAHAQTSISSSSGAPTLPAPDSTQYKGTGSIGPSTSIAFNAACDNGGSNCTVKLTLSPTVFDLQWQYVSAPTPTTDCAVGTFTAGTFRDVTASTILTITKNKSCNIVLQFQAKALNGSTSWTTFQSPNTYVQPVTLTLTKP